MVYSNAPCHPTILPPNDNKYKGIETKPIIKGQESMPVVVPIYVKDPQLPTIMPKK